MTARPPHGPLGTRLRAVHARVRRAIALRHALRATAAAIVLLVAAVTLALALPRTPLTAGLRLALFAIGALTAVAVAVRGAARETPRYDGWLESLEERFTDLRSWLRAALDLERAPAAHTSPELADAVRDEAVRRLATTPLTTSVPSVRATAPLVAMVAATASLAEPSRWHPPPRSTPGARCGRRVPPPRRSRWWSSRAASCWCRAPRSRCAPR